MDFHQLRGPGRPRKGTDFKRFQGPDPTKRSPGQRTRLSCRSPCSVKETPDLKGFAESEEAMKLIKGLQIYYNI